MGNDSIFTEEWFWAAIAALVAVAGVVGGLVSWGVATWLKHRERPEPEWVATASAYASVGSKYGNPDLIHVRGRLVNAGDGHAFNVALTGVDCRPFINPEDVDVDQRRGFLATGDRVRFTAEADLDKWDSARVLVTWIDPPTRLKKRRTHEIRLCELTERPTYTVTDPDSGVVTEVAV